MKLLAVYLLIINAIAFSLMLVDKYKAKKNLWRIPEGTLLWAAILGGSIGALAGMHLARHKTKHPRFTIGVPIILALQAVAVITILSLLHNNIP